MSLKSKIIEDLKFAMKSGDNVGRDTLRMLDSMIKNAEIEKKKKEEGLTDAEIQEVVIRAIKQRKDSIAQYESGGRPELAEKEEKEIEILSRYMPEQLGEDDVRAIVSETATEIGATSKSDMGKLMGAAMAKLKGKADGQLVKKVVEGVLDK